MGGLVPASDLHKKNNVKNAIKKQTYREILEQISRKITRSSTMGNTTLIVTVPPFVMGCPTFDQVTATTYILRQLINGGYRATRINLTSILVDWTPVKISTEPKHTERHVLEQDYQIPSLINLKKYANKYNWRVYIEHIF